MKLLAMLTPTTLLALVAALAAPGRAQDDSAKTPVAQKAPDLSLRLRDGNQPLLTRAKTQLDKVRAATERLAARAGKPDEVRGKSEPLRREIVEQYRTLHQLRELADELVLRGELDGLALHKQIDALRPPLDAAVTELRPALGTPQGLSNAMIRRAKDQLSSLKRIDNLINQQRWSSAYTEYNELLESADEFGRFPDAKEAEQLYKPLEDRAAQFMPGYLVEKKGTLVESLGSEFAAARPDVASLLQKLAATSRAAKENRTIRWNDQTTTGAECLASVVDEWGRLEAAAVRAAAVAHASGTPAEHQLKALLVDYEAARVRVLALVREVIGAEADSLAEAQFDTRYAAYLVVLPKLMTAMHATPEDLQPAVTALNLLVAKSPALDTRVRAYRAATDETIRWRRRIVQRQLNVARTQKPAAEPLAKLLDRPPALPGQEGPGGLKRVNQSFWTPGQPPDFVAKTWTDQWKDVNATVPNWRVLWPTGGDPRFVSPWHRRTSAEFEFPRSWLVGLTDSLAKDLLASSTRPALTLEAAMSLESSLHGPFIEAGGAITGAAADNLADRLWDLDEPLDLAGALRPDALVSYPSIAALVRLRLKPAWIAHDLYFWSSAPPPPASSTPDIPAPPATIASQPTADAAPRDPNAAAPPPGSAAAPGRSSAATPATTTSSGDTAKKSEPAKAKPPVPKGGVSF